MTAEQNCSSDPTLHDLGKQMMHNSLGRHEWPLMYNVWCVRKTTEVSGLKSYIIKNEDPHSDHNSYIVSYMIDLWSSYLIDTSLT